MTCKTHIAVANAVNLLLFNPTSTRELAILIGATTLGSVICDLDIVTSDSHKYVDYLVLGVSLVVFGLLILELYTSIGLLTYLKSKTTLFQFLVSFIAFLLTCFYGMHQPHRSFMHSVLGTIVLSTILYIPFKNVAFIFSLGMLSHIILDMLNKKGIAVFYPLKDRFCLKLCSSDKLANNVIFVVSTISIIYLLFI